MTDDLNPQNQTEPDPIGQGAEPMIDGREAAAALRLPFYWFNDREMRTKHRIPHYLMGGLVRYRLSELLNWARRNNRNPQAQTDSEGGADARF